MDILALSLSIINYVMFGTKLFFGKCPPLRRRGIYDAEKKEYEEKYEGAHMWAIVQKSG